LQRREALVDTNSMRGFKERRDIGTCPGAVEKEHEEHEQEEEEEVKEDKMRRERRTRGAKSIGMYMYGDEGVEGSASEESDAEYVPDTTDDEGCESETEERSGTTRPPPPSKRAKRRPSSADEVEERKGATRTQPPSEHAKRKLSSVDELAQLIEREAAQRGKRARCGYMLRV
jgi:hypothetical protein